MPNTPLSSLGKNLNCEIMLLPNTFLSHSCVCCLSQNRSFSADLNTLLCILAASHLVGRLLDESSGLEERYLPSISIDEASLLLRDIVGITDCCQATTTTGNKTLLAICPPSIFQKSIENRYCQAKVKMDNIDTDQRNRDLHAERRAPPGKEGRRLSKKGKSKSAKDGK